MHGLAGPVDGKTFPQVMVAMGSNKDQWIADVVSYIRNSFGNTGAFVTTQDVARLRTATVDRKAPWTASEIEASLPRLLVPSESWKVTASHEGHPSPQANAEGGYNYRGNAAGALTFMGWTTGESQRPDMWWQLELPAPVMLTEIQFASSTVGSGAKQMSTFPRAFRIQVSTDGQAWSAPVAEGQGGPGTAVITFAPVSARFVRITQTADTADAPPWAMRLLRLYRASH